MTTDNINLIYNDKGLIPAVIQNIVTNKVLMLGYLNEESYNLTVESGKVWFYSRSRQKLWQKGETSGNYLNVAAICTDCDRDTLLIKVIPQGPTCHTGEESCFFNNILDNKANYDKSSDILFHLQDVIKRRRHTPIKNSYTNYLLDTGMDKILKKVGEETAETIIAAKNNDKIEIENEVSDLIYHLFVMLEASPASFTDVLNTLTDRHKK